MIPLNTELRARILAESPQHGPILLAELDLLYALIEKKDEALRVFKRYGTHRKSCVQMSGKSCSCGFDHAATLAGAIALSLPAKEKK